MTLFCLPLVKWACFCLTLVWPLNNLNWGWCFVKWSVLHVKHLGLAVSIHTSTSWELPGFIFLFSYLLQATSFARRGMLIHAGCHGYVHLNFILFHEMYMTNCYSCGHSLPLWEGGSSTQHHVTLCKETHFLGRIFWIYRRDCRRRSSFCNIGQFGYLSMCFIHVFPYFLIHTLLYF